MVDSEKIEQTNDEKRTVALKKRLLQHVQYWYPKYDKEDFSDKNYEFFFHADDYPHEVWSIEFLRRQKHMIK